MDENIVVVTAVMMAAVGVAAYVAIADGREIRGPNEEQFTVRSNQFEKALKGPAFGWFVRMVRCDFYTFIKIVQRVQAVWEEVNGCMPSRRGATTVMKRVALCMHYLSCGGTMTSVASAFGISHTRAVVYINEVMRCLVHVSKSVIHDETGPEHWATVAKGFEAIVGFPDVVGAVDGTLIRIARPAEYEGWYCRKGFPAVNVQAVVDYRMRFSSCSVRAGSANDQSLWNRSGYRLHLLGRLPEQYHLVGDSGYKIWSHLVTPYPEQEAGDSRTKRHYNYCHSRTRIVVERAFGSLKNRWRILLGKLDQKSEATLRNTIVSCIVLHNWLIDLHDTVDVGGEDPFVGVNLGLNGTFVCAENEEHHEKGKKKREIIKRYLRNMQEL